MLKMLHNTSGMSLFSQWTLSLQHLLAVFAGTLIVPVVTGLPVSVTLLFSGISTLIFQFFTRGKIPLFYSCSFVFISGVMLIKQTGIDSGKTPAMALCYASLGVFISGFVYIILGQVVRHVSFRRIKKLVPPVLYGSYIMALGICMVGSAFEQVETDWIVAHVGIAVIIIVQFCCKGFVKLIPVLMGILAATITAGIKGGIDFSHVADAPWIAMPFNRQYMALSVFEDFDPSLLGVSVITILPLVLLSVMEHVADLLAISQTTKVDYIRRIGLPRTLSANGLATMMSSLFGAPATTSFTQTTGLIAINKICAPRLLTMAALMMILLAFCPKAGAILAAIPGAAINAATLLMYGMVIVIGIRAMVDFNVELTNTKNILIFSIVTSLTVGIRFVLKDDVAICGLHLSALTVAGLTGLLLNIILPDNHESDEKAP